MEEAKLQGYEFTKVRTSDHGHSLGAKDVLDDANNDNMNEHNNSP